MEKKTDQFIAEHFIKQLPAFKSDFFQRQRDMDKVIVWLTALSTGSIGLILTQSKNLSICEPVFLKASMLFFVCCILSGAVFRSFIYILEGIQSTLMFNFESFCYGYTANLKGPIELPENVTKEDIAKYLKEDMGLDYDHWLEHEYLDAQFWKEHYESWADYWKKSESDGLKAIGRAYAPIMNKLPSETEDLFLPKEVEPVKSLKYTILLSVCNISYHLILISFCLAILSIVVGYVRS